MQHRNPVRNASRANEMDIGSETVTRKRQMRPRKEDKNL